jgi:hypothetical protein
MMRSGFFLGVLALMPACGSTVHRDGAAPPSDAGVESIRPLADSALADGAGSAIEASIPVTADGAADRAANDLLAPDVAIVPPDAVPDSPVNASPEAGLVQADGPVDGGDAGDACWYTTQGGGQAFQHFRFSFVAPDQATYACPASALLADAAAPWPTELTGRTTSVSDSEFTIDTCPSAGACSPSLYTFKLEAPGAKSTMPVGRQVKVVWQIAIRPMWGCSHWLAVLDAEAGPTSGMVWFLGNGGFQFSVSELPFAVSLQSRDCGSLRDARPAGVGDYAFSFTSKYGPASSLALGTREAGLFTFTSGQGAQQTLDIHCLDALQSGYTDDYWSWDYWAVNQTPVETPSDGGTLDLATALSGKTLTYWATAEWRRPDGGSLGFIPADQDYVTVTPYAKDVMVFSDDGSTLQMTTIQGVGASVAGTRTSTDQGKWAYRLAYFASGELVVWISGTTIYALETQYGSGLPVISATRGELRAN